MTVQTFLKAAQASGLAHNSGAGGEFILVGTSKQLEVLERALQGDGGYVPGVMRCDRCKFELTRVSLNVNVGTATAGDSEPEPCPNGCGPLRPTTWKEQATELANALETWCDRAIAAEKALATSGATTAASLRLLTEAEAGYCECNTFDSSAREIQREFCKVNGLAAPATGMEGTPK